MLFSQMKRQRTSLFHRRRASTRRWELSLPESVPSKILCCSSRFTFFESEWFVGGKRATWKCLAQIIDRTVLVVVFSMSSSPNVKKCFRYEIIFVCFCCVFIEEFVCSALLDRSIFMLGVGESELSFPRFSWCSTTIESGEKIRALLPGGWRRQLLVTSTKTIFSLCWSIDLCFNIEQFSWHFAQNKEKNFCVLDELRSRSDGEERKSGKEDSTTEQIQLIKKSSLHWEIVLNRPEKYNAITQPMYQRIMEILDQAAEDQQLLLLAFTGKGKYYSSGTDLADFAKAAVRILLSVVIGKSFHCHSRNEMEESLVRQLTFESEVKHLLKLFWQEEQRIDSPVPL